VENQAKKIEGGKYDGSYCHISVCQYSDGSNISTDSLDKQWVIAITEVHENMYVFGPVEWDASLAQSAQNLASDLTKDGTCKTDLSLNKVKGYGVKIHAQTSSGRNIPIPLDVIEYWADNTKNNVFEIMPYGKLVGCGQSIEPMKNSNYCSISVCHYSYSS